MYDIVIGRTPHDKDTFGTEGTILIGKHYVTMGRTVSLSNKVLLDVIRSHVILVCGKRGSGKSYTLATIAEGVSDLPDHIKQNISIILLDTMGIYWTMKYPNQKDRDLLREWGLQPKPLDVNIYTPEGFFESYKKKDIPTDFSFSLKPSELNAGDWLATFETTMNEPLGILIERVIYDLKETGKPYGMKEIMARIEKDKESSRDTVNAAKNQFKNADSWGLFSDKGTAINELAKPGEVTVLDLSCYASADNGWNIKNLVIGLIAEKLFLQRMTARKDEEFHDIHKSMHYFGDQDETKQQFPLVWLVIDEAHEFLPRKGKTLATDPLVTILREGRQPGISLVLATQQPGKIHSDVITQADTVLSHRITAKLDVEALGALAQSYMKDTLVGQLDVLPREKGAGVIFDDTNEKSYPVRIRPRFTWHGGDDPRALKKPSKTFGDI